MHTASWNIVTKVPLLKVAMGIRIPCAPHGSEPLPYLSLASCMHALISCYYGLKHMNAHIMYSAQTLPYTTGQSHILSTVIHYSIPHP